MIKTDLKKLTVAYFSMEIALNQRLKTYAGGLGVLAGDILLSAADQNFSMAGITLLNRRGYFKQKITTTGEQLTRADKSDFSVLKKLPQEVTVNIGQDEVRIGVWRYLIKGRNNFSVPVYLLDTNLAVNHRKDRALTGELYGGDAEYRLRQEIVLGRGGVKMLRALGYENIKKFHLNEGHGSLATIELFLHSRQKTEAQKISAVRRRCVFTTHTPIAKGQDIFSAETVLKYQPDFPVNLPALISAGGINFTLLGFYFSAHINAVSRKHQMTSEKLFPGYKIKAITNGVNSSRWSAPEFKSLYDKYSPKWRADGTRLSAAAIIPLADIRRAHNQAKKRLFNYLNKSQSVNFDPTIFTLGFARRFTAYKRPDFLLQDIKKLVTAQKSVGRMQIIYAGKAHPRDKAGQALIKKIWGLSKKLKNKITIFFWENYDLAKAQLLTAGVDLWLNTPLIPNEASGTSGMKAAHNGVPQLSTLDGWWPEGYVQNKTGWTIKESDKKKESNNLSSLLITEILPLYYQAPEKWTKIMRTTISINAAYFNSDRVLRQYIKKIYN